MSSGLTSISRFFRNKGAVAGVFVVVGLAATSFVIFLVFWFRRQRRNKRLEHDSEVEATLAAHGYRRALVDGDDDDPAPSHMSTTLSQGLSAGRSSNHDIGRRISSPNMTMAFPATASTYHDSEETSHDYGFDPYHEFGVVHHRAQTSNQQPNHASTFTNVGPPPKTGRGTSSGHITSDSSGSSEPLLGGSHSSGHSTPTLIPTLASRDGLGVVDKMKMITRSASKKTQPEISTNDDFEYDPYPRPLLEVSGAICSIMIIF
jgi:hypothetical protein